MVVIKIGGKALQPETIPGLAAELAELADRRALVFVHGGGKEVTRLSEQLGIESRFEEGLRMTTETEMQVVDMVLSGQKNKELVRSLQAHGINAVGLSGSDGALFRGSPVRDRAGTPTRTGSLGRVEPDIVQHLLSGGYTPVVASTFMASDGTPLNLNADDAALALAGALEAETLLFLSDVDGVQGENGRIATIPTSEAERYIEAGTISGGMVPKLRSSVGAVQNAVERIIIGRYAEDGDLARLLDGARGTRIVHG